MKKKILILGNSAKEYSLAKYLSDNNEVYVAPGSDTIKEFAQCVDIRENSVSELLEFVMENGIDMTIPVSQSSLKTNIVEVFNNNNQQVFAPSLNSFKLISDKAFAKKTLYKLRVSTPKFGIFEKQNMASDYIKNLKKTFVIKTNDSSSAVILTSSLQAKNILDSLFAEKNQKVIIEDYVWGTPFCFYALTDGYKAIPFGSSIVYKHSLEGDGGQLTGGMGACSPNYKLSIENEYYLMDNVVYPALEHLEREGNPYLGIFGINGILTEDSRIQVLGFQSFMQDADCQPILNGLDSDILNLFESCVLGAFSDEIEFINQRDIASTSLVLTCKNKENIQNAINGLESLDETTKIAFYPTVHKNRYLEYEAQKGAVLVLTSSGRTLKSATDKVYSEAEEIKFKGLFYRKDICRSTKLMD